jgi:hypothetical protein
MDDGDGILQQYVNIVIPCIFGCVAMMAVLMKLHLPFSLNFPLKRFLNILLRTGIFLVISLFFSTISDPKSLQRKSVASRVRFPIPIAFNIFIWLFDCIYNIVFLHQSVLLCYFCWNVTGTCAICFTCC